MQNEPPRAFAKSEVHSGYAQCYILLNSIINNFNTLDLPQDPLQFHQQQPFELVLHLDL